MLIAALLAISSPAAAPACTLDAAVPASAREMVRDPDRWLDRCVRLEGYVSANRYLADVAGIYAYLATDSDDRLNDGWLGLYLPARRQPALRRGTVWGVLQDCARNYERAQSEAGPDTIIMMLGYCHYQGGLNLQRGGFRPSGPAAFYRQTDEAARTLFGDLIEATPDHGPPAEVEALADRFLDAVRTGDAATLRELVTPWSETFDEPADEDAFHAFVRGEGGSPVIDLRTAPEPQRRYFREKETSADREFGHAEDWHICFCREADCTGRWPISATDASTLQRRPYVCLRAINSRTQREAADELSLDRADNGLLEPVS